MVRKHKKQNKETKPVICIIRSVLIATAVTIVLVVLLSYLLYKGILSVNTVPVANTVIKTVSAALCGFFTACFVKEKRILYSAVAGIAYVLTAFLAFSAFCGELSFSLGTLSDIAIGAIASVLTAFVHNLIK